MRPQHVTSVRAAAKITGAKVRGVKINSEELVFEPQSKPKAGTYTFDVAQAAKGGSAGASSLVLQTVLLPLALVEGSSKLTLRGGSHVAWSPPYDYIKRVFLPTLARMGIQAKASIKRWGWYPHGGGEVMVTIHGQVSPLQGVDLSQRGELLRVRGLSASSNLPKHIRVRQEKAALQVLRSNGLNARVEARDTPSKGMGTVVFLWAEFANSVAGFTSLGEKGKPAEDVAEEAAQALIQFVGTTSALDRYLADQLILPMALADGASRFTTEVVTQHLLTNAWVANQFFPGRVRVEGDEGQPGSCLVGEP
jgi:RNA 3'-terminal phosphate cyclase (ATP)